MLARSLLALVGRQAMLAVPDRVRLDIGARHHERTRLAALAFGDLLHAAAGGDRSRVLLQDLRAILLDRMFVMMLDQQPVGSFSAIAIVAHPHQDETAMQPLAMKRELEVALLQGLFWRLAAFRLPVAAIPQHHRATAILTLWNRAFEVAIVERVILDLDHETLVVRIERWPLSHRPGFEHPVELEPQIIMEPCGVVLLDHEPPPVRRLDLHLAARFAGLEIALGTVFREIVGHWCRGPFQSYEERRRHLPPDRRFSQDDNAAGGPEFRWAWVRASRTVDIAAKAGMCSICFGAGPPDNAPIRHR